MVRIRFTRLDFRYAICIFCVAESDSIKIRFYYRFGGTLLGPVRFTHIETCTREVCRTFKLVEDVESAIEELKELDEKLARLRSELAEVQSHSEKPEETSTPISTPREPPDYRAMLLSPSPDLARAKRLIAARQSAIRSVKRILSEARAASTN